MKKALYNIADILVVVFLASFTLFLFGMTFYLLGSGIIGGAILLALTVVMFGFITSEAIETTSHIYNYRNNKQ